MKYFNILLSTLILFSFSTIAQEKEYPQQAQMKPEMSEYWTPQPSIVAPGSVHKEAVKAPSDAIILFDGSDLSEWVNSRGETPEWTVQDGVFTVRRGTGDISTKRVFNDFQLHIEWRVPEGVTGESQGRGNSGVFLQNRYEIQILDNFDNETYVNGQAGSVYKQNPPLVNAMNPPGVWNTYDIIYTAPTFKEDGTFRTHPRVTVLHNGVLVQNNTIILGTTEYIGFPKVNEHGAAPIRLQDHGDPISFRNIWIREL